MFCVFGAIPTPNHWRQTTSLKFYATRLVLDGLLLALSSVCRRLVRFGRVWTAVRPARTHLPSNSTGLDFECFWPCRWCNRILWQSWISNASCSSCRGNRHDIERAHRASFGTAASAAAGFFVRRFAVSHLIVYRRFPFRFASLDRWPDSEVSATVHSLPAFFRFFSPIFQPRWLRFSTLFLCTELTESSSPNCRLNEFHGIFLFYPMLFFTLRAIYYVVVGSSPRITALMFEIILLVLRFWKSLVVFDIHSQRF